MEQASTLNPSPENDAMSLSTALQRAATFVVDQSRQAAEYQRSIEELRQQIAQVKSDVQSALAEQQRLRDELYRTVSERDAAKKEAADNKALAESYSHDLDNTRGQLDAVTKERDDYKARLGSTEYDLNNRTNDRDYWRSRAERAEKAHEEASAKLAKMQESFKAIFEPAQEVQAASTVSAHPVQQAGETSFSYWDNAGQHHSS